MNAGGKFGADLLEACVEIGLCPCGGLDVFLAHLLLDERAADELLEGALGSECAGGLSGGVEDGEANFFVYVAQENGVIVDDGDYAVERL